MSIVQVPLPILPILIRDRGTFSLLQMVTNDLFLSKYDEDGNFPIAGAAGGSGDIAYTIDLDDDNNIYIGGVFSRIQLTLT